MVNVLGAHTYADQGPYVVTVQLSDLSSGNSAIALDYGVVLPLGQDTQLQSTSYDGLSYDGTAAQTVTSFGNPLSLQANGTLDYTLATTTAGIGSSASSTDTASLSFNVSADYNNFDDDTGSFTPGSFSSNATGSDSLNQQLLQGDLNSLASGTTSDSGTLSLQGNGDASSGDFSWTRTLTGSNDSTQLAGVTGDGTYTETTSVASSYASVSETGNYNTDSYTRTESDVSTTTTTDSGNDWGDNYTSTTKSRLRCKPPTAAAGKLPTCRCLDRV